MKGKKMLALLLSVAALLTGCGTAAGGETPPAAPNREESVPQPIPTATPPRESTAEELYALQCEYIGDAAACGELLSALGLAQLGSYTIHLQTDKAPLGITVHLTPEGERPTAELDADMSRCGYLFLALVANAERFSWDYETPNGTHSCYVDDSFNVKPYAESPEAFAELYEVVELLAAAEQWPADVLISSGSEAYTMYGADAATISALWAGVKSLKLKSVTEVPDLDDALNLVFYDENGAVLAAYSFYGSYCRTGGTELYKCASDSFSYRNVRWFYELSRISEHYADGVYTPRG